MPTLQIHTLPALTDIVAEAGGLNAPTAAVVPDRLFVGATTPFPVSDSSRIFPNVGPRASVVSLPFLVECASGRLLGGLAEASAESGVELLHVNPADRPALLPGDAITGASIGWAAGAPAPANPVYIGVGIYAYPIFDDGFSPLVMNYVSRVESNASFAPYSSGRCFGWLNTLIGTPFGARYPGLSIVGFSDLGHTRWGMNTAYKALGSIDVGGFMAMPKHIVFGVDATWTLEEQVRATEFSAAISAPAITRLEELTGRRIVGFNWYGHGFWDVGDTAFFVKLGQSSGSSRGEFTSAQARPTIARIPYDYSALFREPMHRGRTTPFGKLGRLNAGEYSDTLLLKTTTDFSSARGFFISYKEA